jgi:hypothetical protein
VLRTGESILAASAVVAGWSGVRGAPVDGPPRERGMKRCDSRSLSWSLIHWYSVELCLRLPPSQAATASSLKTGLSLESKLSLMVAADKSGQDLRK